MKLRVTTLLDIYSIDLAGEPPVTALGNTYFLGAVEYLTGRPIVSSTKTSSGAEDINFVQEEILRP